VVVSGILVMSFSGCSVVRDTSADIGPVAYGFANFAAHYLPSIVTLALTRWVADEQMEKIFPTIIDAKWLSVVHKELWSALILFVAYGSLVDVNAAYGCHISNTTIIALVAVVVLCIHLLIDRLLCTPRRRRQSEQGKTESIEALLET